MKGYGYQLRFTWGGSSYSYDYFDAESHLAAIDKAYEIVRQRRDYAATCFFPKYPKRIKLFEYDSDRKKPKKDGWSIAL